jgi:hypothetical protein
MNVSIIGMLHFNKKLDVNNALLRISDSLAFGATARHVYAVVDDAEHKRKLFVKAKNNLATSDNKSLAFRFGVRDVDGFRNPRRESSPRRIVRRVRLAVSGKVELRSSGTDGDGRNGKGVEGCQPLRVWQTWHPWHPCHIVVESRPCPGLAAEECQECQPCHVPMRPLEPVPTAHATSGLSEPDQVDARPISRWRRLFPFRQ